MDAGERLSAYVAGELDVEERRALEAALADDPELRAQLERIRDVDRLLGAMPPVEPPPDFSARLRERVAAELAEAPRDHLAQRRAGRVPLWTSLRPLAVAGAAAAVILVVGVGAGIVLRGGGLDSGDESAVTEMAADSAVEAEAGPAVTVFQTDNDYSDLELQRLAVNVDTQFVIGPDLTEPEAAALQERLLAQLQASAAALEDTALRATTETEAEAGGDAESAGESAEQDDGGDTTASERRTDPLTAATSCLPTLLDEHPDPFVPVSAELAEYQGRSAVIYVIGTEDPDTGTYNRVEVWAIGTDTCSVLSRVDYDRG